MADTTKIQWTDATWNPAEGCDKVSAGCKMCYMFQQAERYGKNPRHVRRTTTVFNMPLKYKPTASNCWGGRPLIFTASQTDIFHPAIDAYRHEIWDIIRACPHLIFQVLTKRPERFAECLPADWGNGWENVWLMVSVETQAAAEQRIPILLNTPAFKRGVSGEPLLGDVDFTNIQIRPEGTPDVSVGRLNALAGMAYYTNGNVEPVEHLDWVIIGGESGDINHTEYRARPAEMLWFGNIIRKCAEYHVPVFMKQLGTQLAHKYNLKDKKHGGDITEFPHSFLKVRQFPQITEVIMETPSGKAVDKPGKQKPLKILGEIYVS